MAEVRCPICSKMNPADAEVCRFCGTNLKPEGPNAGQGLTPAGGDQGGDAPDWLAKIRGRARSETSGPSDLFGDSAGQGDESEDWLSSLQGGPSEEEDAGDDWLSRLGGEQDEPLNPPGTKPGGEEPGGQEPDLPDWLSGLGQEEISSGDTAQPQMPGDSSSSTGWSGLESFSFEEPAPEAGSGEAADDTDDWMKNLTGPQAGAGGQAGQQPESPLPPGGEEDLSWLRGFEASEPESGQPLAGDSGFDPLGFFAAEEGNPPPGPQDSGLPGASGTGGEDDVPEWLKAFDETPAQAPGEAPEPDFSQWNAIGGQDDASFSLPQEEDQPSSLSEDDHLPDWLKGLSAEEEPQPGDSQEQVPDWLRGEPEPIAPAGAGEGSDMPDWLSSGLGEQQEPAAEFSLDQPQEPSGLEYRPEDTGLPEWLQAEQGAAAGEPEAGEFEEPQPAGEFPDWLSSLSTEQEPAAEESFEMPEAEMPEPASTPDWLGGFGATLAAAETAGEEEQPLPPEEQPEAPMPAAGTGPGPFIGEDMPDWLGEFQSEEAGQPATPEFAMAAGDQPVDNKPFEVDLPDWLNEEGEQERAAAEAGLAGISTDEAGEVEQLAEADLPSWVQAMRPVESGLTGDAGVVESDDRVEKAGPLAGMRGVLPADESVVHYRKPPVYSVKLRVTEKQRGQITLLDSVLARETQPKAAAPVHSQRPWFFPRVVVALFLLVMLTAMVMINSPIFNLPRFGPPAIANMYEQVESLQAGDAVLMAVDFEPAFSGEMRFASSHLIDHLMRKQARIAIVSTVPTGPALADELLRNVGLQNQEFSLAENVENLGYLPGGTISLLEFARNPSRAAPGYWDGSEPWTNSPVLQGIDGIQNFKRVVVLTDRAEVGRAWVEQVQPLLGDVPLLVVSSAQAGPLLEPYVSSGQVKGMVSGLMGGSLYGQWTGRNDPNTAPLRYWSAYQAGLLIAFVLVLLGAVFSAVSALIQPKPRQRRTRQREPNQKGKG